MHNHTMAELTDYNDAKDFLSGANHQHLLLGNGFSISLRPEIFQYGSLFNNADFSEAPRLTELFHELQTTDFELVIQYLLNAARVVEVYRPKLVRLATRLRDDAELVKTALVEAVAKHHPDRPYDIEPGNYENCRSFLESYRHIFSLNYDVLLYWTLMQDEVDELDIVPDDGFRHPEEDPDLPWVSWQQSQSSTVHFLHGALHLFDQGTDIIKYTWSKTDIPIVDQIRSALDEDKYPIFVSEGSSPSKWRKIMHNAYLHKAFRSFEACCNNGNAALSVFGHSLAENDDHILRCIAKGRLKRLAIGIYGGASDDDIGNIEAAAEKIRAKRQKISDGKSDIDIRYFDTRTANIWGND